jgi:hypothetical protein
MFEHWETSPRVEEVEKKGVPEYRKTVPSPPGAAL